MARFITDKDRRDANTAEEAAADKARKAEHAEKVKAAMPKFRRITPILREILHEFGLARELAEPNPKVEGTKIYLSGAFNVEIDLENPTRLFINSPGYKFKEEDLSALGQAIAKETKMPTYTREYDGGRPIGGDDWEEGRGWYITKSFSPSSKPKNKRT